MQLKTNPNTLALKKIDLHWIIEDKFYFKWFTKLLNELKNESNIFNYHIYFPNKSPASFSEKSMYITTNAMNKNTNASIIDNLWEVVSFHLPDWNEKLSESIDEIPKLGSRVFYSGPRKYGKELKKSCKGLGIPFNSKKY